MDKRLKNEDWLLCAISRIASKRFVDRRDGRSDWSQVVSCVWDTYDATRKTRDVSSIHPQCKASCIEAASRLGLAETASVFATPGKMFAKEFTTRFDVVCDELRSVSESHPK